ncbi:MAG TPA: hypothetical protein VHF50_05345 [Solirubrobacterales bacterium]|nr:hypothetical protein [Solirubrobacterales bacterium]
MKAGKLVVLAVVCWAIAAPAVVAAPADLDRSFGGDGIVEVKGPGGGLLPGESGARMALGPADEIFVLYSTYQPCDPPFGCTVELTVARYSGDGVLDQSFGAGAAPHLVVRQNAFDHYFDLAVTPDGKPVIAAFDEIGGGLVVARLDHTGHLDGAFGVGGVTRRPAVESTDVPIRGAVVAVQDDGKVLAAAEGQRESESSSRLLVERFLANGQPDPEFGSGGLATMLLTTRSQPAGIVPLSGGGPYVPTPPCCVGGPGLFGGGFSVARFGANGQPDAGWAGSGRLFFSTPGAEGGVEAVAAAPDGGIFLSYEAQGSTVSSGGNLIKLLPDGALDNRFGGDGQVRLSSRGGAPSPNDLAVDGSGRLIGVGWLGKMVAFRLRPDGGLDRTFNGGSHLLLPFGGSHSGSTPYQVAVQRRGRIVALGESTCCHDKAFGLVRLRGGNDRSRCLGKRATVVGTRRADELTGTPRRDVIAALDGNDKVRGLSGSDLICGGKGKDQLLGGPGRDTVQQNPVRPRRVR